MTLSPSDLIGQEMKRLRKLRGLTLDKVARMSGVSRLTVFNLENGKNSTRLSTLTQIAQALDSKIVIEPYPQPEDLEI